MSQQGRFLRTVILTVLSSSFVCAAPLASAQISAYLNFPVNEAGAPPALLSQTGAFTDLANLTPVAGLEYYDVNQPLWSDAAEKFRWAGIPTGSTISFSPKGRWMFPAGTVLIKHFELGAEARRIETRFEIFRPTGGAYFLTYQWRDDQTEADLVSSAGLETVINFADGSSQNWAYPSHADCAECHNYQPSPALGPNTRQLNRAAKGSAVNQLEHWNSLGLFSPSFNLADLPNLDKLVPISDESAPLEIRARSYLDTNCSVCHNPTNIVASAARFDFSFNTPLDFAGIVNGNVLTPLVTPYSKIIKPQDPISSVAFHRLSSDNLGLRMPPIGRDIVDEEARDLLLRWILSLDPLDGLDVEGYLSRWNFDNSLADETGANPATYSGSPSYETGIMNDAIELGGGGDHIDLGTIDISGSGAAITLWMLSDDTEITAPLISKANGPLSSDAFWSITQNADGSIRAQMKTDDSTVVTTTAPGTALAGQWIHLAAVYDGQNLFLYVEGSEAARSEGEGQIIGSPSAAVFIGAQPTSTSTDTFTGFIDDVRIYDHALGTAEVGIVRNSVFLENEPPTTSIDQPNEHLFVLAGAPVSFSGTSTDPEEGDISADAIWYSSRDGELTGGSSYSSTKRTIGTHIFVMTANDDGNIAASDSRIVTIAPGFEPYLESFGLDEEDLDPMVDTDDDGIVQLQEYAFHLNPTGQDSIPITAVDSGIAFSVSNLALDLEYVVQSSPDLETWTDGTVYQPLGASIQRTPAADMHQLSALNLGATTTITETSTAPDRRFFRILIRQL